MNSETLITKENAEIGMNAVENTEENRPWVDIVFENRNQAYGAYVLRKEYSNNVFIGLIVTGLLLLFVIFFPLLAKLLGNDSQEDKPAPKKLVYTELSAPPPIDKQKPPPPQVKLPKLQKVIKFVPPKVVKEEIIEEVPTIEEIKQSEVAAEAVEGPTEMVFEEPVEEVVQLEDELFTVVEQNPEFEGGYEAMMAFIQKHMKYPPIARKMGIEGTVYLTFIVRKDGTISDVGILRGIMTECDSEAVRVVSKMPPWKPGKQNGRNVNVRFTLPLKFRLS